MRTTRTITATLGLSFGLIGWIGCGGGTEKATETAVTETAETARPPVPPREAESEPSMCDLMNAAEVDAALGGKLPLGPAQSFDGSCQFPVNFGVEGNTVSFSMLSRGNYDAYKGYEDQSSVDFEYIEGLGQEAFVLNNAQVCVLLSDTEALFVGAQVISVQEELPISQEELKAGLVEIATKVEAQL